MSSEATAIVGERDLDSPYERLRERVRDRQAAAQRDGALRAERRRSTGIRRVITATRIRKPSGA